jgi:hypothetical protein
MTLHLAPQLVVVLTLDDIPAHADDPQRHRNLRVNPPPSSCQVVEGASRARAG